MEKLSEIRFSEELKKRVGEKLGAAYSVELSGVPDNRADAGLFILISPKGNDAMLARGRISPIYQAYLAGHEIDTLVDALVLNVIQHEPSNEESDNFVLFLSDWNQVKHSVMFQLLNYEKNAEYLVGKKFIRYHDMAIVFVCPFWNGGKLSKVYPGSDCLDIWGISLKELYHCASENTQRMHPYSLTDGHTLNEIQLEQITPEMKIVNLSFEGPQAFGAAAILYEGMVENLADQFESDIAIVPLSTRTIVICVAPSKEYARRFVWMMRLANEPYPDKLSDYVYYFSRKSKTITCIGDVTGSVEED